MYLQFYNLRKAPFQPGTAPEFFWKGEKYSAVLRGLQRAVEKGGGVSLLTGEVGTGKTAVLHRLLGMLGKDVMACLIPDPHLSVPDFYRLILHAFRIRRNIDNRMAFAQCLDDLSQKAGRRGKKILLVIDEAQCLSPQLTAEIAAMQKLPLNTAGRLHVCLVAQTGSGRRSIAPLIEALAPHITADLHLDPLNPDETAAYVRHRLKTAGAGEDLFSDEALKAVFQYSGGYPIQVNLVCDFALFSGFAERAPQIGEDIVNWSAQGLHLPDSADEQSEDELLEALYRPAAPAGRHRCRSKTTLPAGLMDRPPAPCVGPARRTRRPAAESRRPPASAASLLKPPWQRRPCWRSWGPGMRPTRSTPARFPAGRVLPHRLRPPPVPLPENFPCTPGALPAQTRWPRPPPQTKCRSGQQPKARARRRRPPGHGASRPPWIRLQRPRRRLKPAPRHCRPAHHRTGQAPPPFFRLPPRRLHTGKRPPPKSQARHLSPPTRTRLPPAKERRPRIRRRPKNPHRRPRARFRQTLPAPLPGRPRRRPRRIPLPATARCRPQKHPERRSRQTDP